MSDTTKANLRLGWVGVQVDILNLQNIVCWVATEVQRVVARDLEFFLDSELITTHPRRACRDGNSAEGGNEEIGELHRGDQARDSLWNGRDRVLELYQVRLSLEKEFKGMGSRMSSVRLPQRQQLSRVNEAGLSSLKHGSAAGERHPRGHLHLHR